MAEQKTAVTPAREEHRPARRGQRLGASPFGFWQGFAEEVDRLFDDFGVGRGWMTPRLGRSGAPVRSIGTSGWDLWNPEIDMFQRGNDLVVRVDLPGLSKDDVKVDVNEDCLTIQGERRREHEEEREGIYRSERSFGSFYRCIPLPEGAMADQAKANFRDGVLEVTMPAPPEQVTRGRRLEITEGSAAKK